MSTSPPSGQKQVSADAAFRCLLSQVIRLGASYTSGPASHNANRPIHELAHGSLEFDLLPSRLVGASGPSAWISPGLAAARFLYMLTGRRDLKFITQFSRGVRRFSPDGIDLGGSAYGARLFGSRPGDDQVRQCVEMIMRRPNTKRAAAILFDPYTGSEDSVDVACCLGIVFMPRSGILDASIIMRANDAIRLLPYNLFEFSMLTELVARLTGLKVGKYRHLAISMHLRGKSDIELASAFCAAPVTDTDPNDMGEMPDVTWDNLATLKYLAKELSDSLNGSHELLEERVSALISCAQSALGPYWRDLVAAAAMRGLALAGLVNKSEKLVSDLRVMDGTLLKAELMYQYLTSS